MTAQYLLEFLLYPLQLFNFNYRKFFSLTWEGKMPPFMMIFKLLKDTDIPDKARVFHLNFETLNIIKNGTAFFYGQEIKENNHYEHFLLEKSSLNFFPHEVVQIRIVNSQNEHFTGNLYHGGQYRTKGCEDLRKEINKLCFQARKKGLTIEEIELSHTHPSLEILVEHQGESKFIFNGLSSSDKEIAHKLATFLDYPLRVKAITPTANYSMLF